jgi:hypothetical protein
MKARLMFITAVFFFVSSSFSQKEPVAVLSESDIEKYAETIIPMSEELEKLGVENEGYENNPGQMWLVNAEAKSILNKYGWTEAFPTKFSAITWGYTYLRFRQEIDNMPEDQKAQAEQMLPMFQMYMAMVHKDDLALISAHMGELNEVFEEMGEN